MALPKNHPHRRPRRARPGKRHRHGPDHSGPLHEVRHFRRAGRVPLLRRPQERGRLGQAAPAERPAVHGGERSFCPGANFGCGSSREHAPQALQKFGIRAVVAEGFAEIFFGNCTTLGMPCVTASREDIPRIAAAVEADPGDGGRHRRRRARRSVRRQGRSGRPSATAPGTRWSTAGGIRSASLLEGLPAAASVASQLRYMAV